MIDKIKEPSRHEHERGAPLVDDCDNWCKSKYSRWLKAIISKRLELLEIRRGEMTDYSYAVKILKAVAPNVEPLEDIWGVLSQLDNWSVGIQSAIAALKCHVEEEFSVIYERNKTIAEKDARIKELTEALEKIATINTELVLYARDRQESHTKIQRHH